MKMPKAFSTVRLTQLRQYLKTPLSGVNPVWLYGLIMYSLSGKAASVKMVNGMCLSLLGSGLGGGI